MLYLTVSIAIKASFTKIAKAFKKWNKKWISSKVLRNESLEIEN